MLRLTVDGVDDAARTRLGARLHGASVHPPTDPPGDAIVYVYSGRLSVSEIERHLADGRAVLATANSSLDRETLDRLQSRGGKFVLANPERFVPSRLLIRQHLDAGKLGEPGLIRIHHWQPIRDFDADRAALLAPEIDVALWLAGREPDVVFATQVRGEDYQTKHRQSVQVHVGFDGGGMALIDWADLPEGEDYRSLSVIASQGAAYADDHRNVQLHFRTGSPRAVKVDERHLALSNLLQRFVADLAENKLTSLADWNTTLAVVAAVQTSLETREAVPLKGGGA